MDRNQFLSLLLVLVGLAVVFTLLALGWRGRRRRQAHLPPLEAVPSDIGDVLAEDDGFYVATTKEDAPTDRIAIEGLAFRGRAYLTVATAGIQVSIAGSHDFFIPRTAIVGVGRATWTIDRVVNRDGLVFVRWMLGDTIVDSYLRPTALDAVLAALNTLVPIRKASA